MGQRRNDVIDRAIYALAPGRDPPELVAYMMVRYRALNAAQMEAVRRFLVFASEHDDQCDATIAKQALETYWAGCDVGPTIG